MIIEEAQERYDSLELKKEKLLPVIEKANRAVQAIEKEQNYLMTIISGQPEPTTDELITEAETTLKTNELEK